MLRSRCGAADHLLGEAATEGVPRLLVGLAGAALCVLLGVALLVACVPSHPELPGGCAPVLAAAISLIAAPSVLAARRMARALG